MSLLGDVAGAAIGAISGIYGSNVSNSAAFEMQANSIAAQRSLCKIGTNGKLKI